MSEIGGKNEKQKIIRSDNNTHIFNYWSSIIRFAGNSDTDDYYYYGGVVNWDDGFARNFMIFFKGLRNMYRRKVEMYPACIIFPNIMGKKLLNSFLFLAVKASPAASN